jgi:hypothetical protein
MSLRRFKILSLVLAIRRGSRGERGLMGPRI